MNELKPEYNKFQKQVMLCDYVLRNLGIEISKKKLAKAMGLSTTTFNRKCVKNEIIVTKTFTLCNPLVYGLGRTLSDIHGLCKPAKHEPLINLDSLLINYLAFNELPLIGALENLSAQETEILSTDTVDDFMSLSLYISLRENGHFNHNLSTLKGFAYAVRVNNIFKEMATRGYRVHSDNKDLRYLQRVDKSYSFSSLFERKGNYVVGIKSSKTWFTDYSEEVILPYALSKFTELNFKEVECGKDDIVISKEDLINIETKRDMYILLSNMKGMSDGSYVISLNTKDKQLSRKYSTFTSISSDTRKSLGYTNYDISSCLQSIVFNIIDVNKYPYHKRLIDDKKAFRAELAHEADITIEHAKQLLSAADNGQNNQIRNRSTILDCYAKESEKMVDEFIAYMKENNEKLYLVAKLFSKNIYEKQWNKKSKKYDYIDTGIDNKFSLFFFMWTQIERDIREVMIRFFNDAIEVHDAVYSKDPTVDASDIENAILNELGLIIKIEKD